MISRLRCTEHLSLNVLSSGRHRNASTFSQRYRETQLPSFAPLLNALNSRISLHLQQASSRGFSHVYRSRRHIFLYGRASAKNVFPADTMPVPSLEVGHLLSTSVQRRHLSAARVQRLTIFSWLSSKLVTYTAPPPSNNSNVSIGRLNSVYLASRSFSHLYRHRQFLFIQACLPNAEILGGRRTISSVPLSSETSKRSATRNKSRRKIWLLRGAGIGLLIYLSSELLARRNLNSESMLNDLTYVPFVVSKVERVSPDAAIFTLKGDFEKDMSQFQPVASISIKEPNANIQRPYTVLSADAETIEILVKRYDTGDLSRYIHSRKPDSKVYIRKAPSEFVLKDPLSSHYTIIVGGTGVAVAYQITQWLSSVPVSKRPSISIFYSSLSSDEVYLTEQFSKLREVYGDKMRIKYFVDSEATTITAGDLLEEPSQDTTTLVCGSDGFITYVAGRKPEFGQGEIGGLLKTVGVCSGVHKL